VNTVGKQGETDAYNYLRKKHYSILQRNFRSRAAEIDIIAKKDNTYIFVEVKARIGDRMGKPYEAVNYRKISHIKLGALLYSKLHTITSQKLRIDVISIEYNADMSITKLQHFENVTS